MDLISIVVAVYNAERTLKKCVNSLLNQTYKNIEIILVDDCSSDGSLNICEQYTDVHNNIFVVKNDKNSGVSYTRNVGIEKSKGKYICFVDSDDYVEPLYLEILYCNLKKYNTIPICGFVYYNEIENRKPVEYIWSRGDEIVSLADAFKLNDELYLTALWNKLFDNNIIKKYKIRFDEKLSMGEDLRFSVIYFNVARIKNVYVIAKPFYNYVKYSENSLMNDFGLNGINSAIDNLGLIRDLVANFNTRADQEYELRIDKLKSNFIYFISRAKHMTDEEKIKKIKSFKPEFSVNDLKREKRKIFKEKIYNIIHR